MQYVATLDIAIFIFSEKEVQTKPEQDFAPKK
jgi:hypothetical protein